MLLSHVNRRSLLQVQEQLLILFPITLSLMDDTMFWYWNKIVHCTLTELVVEHHILDPEHLVYSNSFLVET
ncbi:hypothetical protein M0802_011203 [Mischocyttarus mexicanus]|nr:hypothetical protein M0802_011203 [Mischocyttarus mexicanus]